MFRCSRCGEEKPRESFTWSLSKGRDCYCRPCRAAYGREHYERNRKRYIRLAGLRSRKEIERRQALVVQYLEEHPCIDCGETDVVVLDFDHLSDKSFNVSYGIRYLRWETVLKEIEKCEVVCANCHRRRTAQRSRSGRFLLSRLPRQRTLF
jgi:hypothetical protein